MLLAAGVAVGPALQTMTAQSAADRTALTCDLPGLAQILANTFGIAVGQGIKGLLVPQEAGLGWVAQEHALNKH